MNSTIKIGRREVNTEDFINAVNNSKSVIEVCNSLPYTDKDGQHTGMNATVYTTLDAIRNQIKEMQINIDHFTSPLYRNKTEKFDAYMERKFKSFNLNANNQAYYEAFEKSINAGSWATYKSSIGNFLESLGEVDFARMANTNKIDAYCNGRANAESHIRSLLIYIVANDINGAKGKIYKDMLLWCVSNRAKKIA